MTTQKIIFLFLLAFMALSSCQKDTESVSDGIVEAESNTDFRSEYDTEHRKDYFRGIAHSQYEIEDVSSILDYTSFLEVLLEHEDEEHLYPEWDHQFNRSMVSFIGDEYIAFTPVFQTPNATKEEAIFLMSHLNDQEVNFLYLKYSHMMEIIELGEGTASDEAILPMFNNWEGLSDNPIYSDASSEPNSFIILRGPSILYCVDFSYCEYLYDCEITREAPENIPVAGLMPSIELRSGGCPCGYAWRFERFCFYIGIPGVGTNGTGDNNGGNDGGGPILGGGGNSSSGSISTAARTLLSQLVGGTLARIFSDMPQTPEEWELFNSLLDDLLAGCPSDQAFINGLKEHIRSYVEGGGSDVESSITSYLVAESRGNDGAKLKCLSDLLREKKCEQLAFNFLFKNRLDMSIAQFEEAVGGFAESCTRQEEFDRHVMDILETIDEPGVLLGRTCSSSFEYVSVGNGYTTQINDVIHKYLTSDLDYFSYIIGEMCIQIGKKDQFDQPITLEKAAELTAFAMDNARFSLFDRMSAGEIITSAQARQEYKQEFKDALNGLIFGPIPNSVSFGPCSGSIPENDLKLRLGPFCIDVF